MYVDKSKKKLEDKPLAMISIDTELVAVQLGTRY